jgi:hypothetical protein
MSIKKLVELDGEYGGWLEIDPVKLRRVANEFRSWLETIHPNNDPLGFLSKDLPIVKAALDGTLPLPYRENPHQREIGEGDLDWCLDKLAPFYNTIHGSLDAPPKVTMKDGRYFAWTEFEDPPL